MSLLFLVFVLASFLLLVLTIFLRELLLFCSLRIDLLRQFIQKNSGIFTLLFIVFFFLEQLLLVILVYLLDLPTYAQLLISIFALVVLTTATMEKFILEKRYQYLAFHAVKIGHENQTYLSDMKNLLDENKALKQKLQRTNQIR